MNNHDFIRIETNMWNVSLMGNRIFPVIQLTRARALMQDDDARGGGVAYHPASFLKVKIGVCDGMGATDKMKRELGASSVSTLQILGGVVILLLVIIMLAWLFAPERPIAPPTSRMSYEAPPTRTAEPPPFQEPFPEYAQPDAPAMPEVVQPAADTQLGDEAADLEYYIEGRIFAQETGEPLPDVEIRLLSNQPSPEDIDVNPRMQALYRSDEEGRYHVPLQGTGHHHIGYRHPDYIQQYALLHIYPDNPVITRNVSLQTGARISGRVTEEGSGRPAAGVTVVVEHAGKQAETDEDGHYEIRGIQFGERNVYVQMEGIPYLPGRELPYQRIRIVQNEHKRNVDFRLAPAGIVWGYVMTPDEDPVQATVMLTGTESILSQALNAMTRPERFMVASSDEEGYYELSGVPLNETWRLYASAHNEEHAPQLVDPFMLSANRREARIDIYLFPGTNIRGIVRDTRRNPVEGAEVVCIPAFSQLLGPLDRAQAFSNATTDEQGHFEITQVPAGSYQLYPFKEGYKFSTTGQAVYPNGYSDMDGVTLTLLPQDEGRYQVYGTVLDSNRRPVTGASVNLAGVSTESFDALDRNAQTDGQGAFRFEGVETGTYQLTAQRDGYAARTLHQVRLNQPNEIVLNAASIIRGQVLVRDSNQAPNSYRVTAQPISSVAGPSVMDGMISGGGSYSGSEPSGRFELSVAAGEYRLEALAMRYVPARMEVSVAAGEVLEGITLYLESSGGVISGEVQTSDGSSPQGTEVLLVESDSADQAWVMMAGASSTTQQVGADGAFQFTMLPEGTYMLLARHPSYAPASAGPVELQVGEHVQDITIDLGAGGALEGYVYQQGRPVAGAMVIVLVGGQPFTTNVDSEGYYYIDGLSAGTHQAIFSTSGAGDFMGLFNTRGVLVEIEEGQVTRQDFGTGDGTRIEGFCSPSPASFIGGRAVLRQPGFPTASLGDFVNVDQVLGNSTGVDSSGYFEFDNVPAGDWQLDIYYFEASASLMSSMRYVHTEIVSVSHEDTDLTLDIALSAY